MVDRPRLLITGGAGFIGRSTVRLAVKKGYHVTVLDNFVFANRAQARRAFGNSPSVELVDGDTRNFDLMKKLVSRSDHVIHLAAASSFIMHVENDLEVSNYTMMGFKTIWEAMRLDGRIKKGVWASTSAVYEERPEDEPRVPFHEGLSIHPPDSKAGCKWWCEQEAQRYSDNFGITSVAFRPFSVYGVGEHTKKGYANVTSLFTWAMMKGHQPTVWAPGTQTRDFIFVEDAARAFLMAVENDKLPTTALNLGYGIEHSFLDVIEIIGQELGVKPEPVFKGVPIDIYARRLWADMTKTKELLGFTPEVDLREGIRRIIKTAEKLSPKTWEEFELENAQHYCDKLDKPALTPVV